MVIGSLKEQEANVPTIGDVEVIHPRHELLQIVRTRQAVVMTFLATFLGLAGVYVWVWFVLVFPDHRPTPTLLLLFRLSGVVCLLIVLLALARCLRGAIWPDVLTVTRRTGTIMRNGKLLARFDEVVGTEVERIAAVIQDPNGFDTAYDYRLLITLKDRGKLRICRVSAYDKAELADLAKELAHILGVGVTLPRDVR